MTLKQLQAEWRALKEGDGPVSLPLAGILTCADALTPFILQQERDSNLILKLVNALEISGPSCAEAILCEEARSRLKEME